MLEGLGCVNRFWESLSGWWKMDNTLSDSVNKSLFRLSGHISIGVWNWAERGDA